MIVEYSRTFVSSSCRGGYGGQVEAITVVVSSMTVSPSADTATRHHRSQTALSYCSLLVLVHAEAALTFFALFFAFVCF